jgi:hypothetical protein
MGVEHENLVEALEGRLGGRKGARDPVHAFSGAILAEVASGGVAVPGFLPCPLSACEISPGLRCHSRTRVPRVRRCTIEGVALA